MLLRTIHAPYVTAVAKTRAPDENQKLKMEIIDIQARGPFTKASVTRLAEIGSANSRLLAPTFSALRFAYQEGGAVGRSALQAMADFLDYNADAAMPAVLKLPATARADLMEEWGTRREENASAAMNVLRHMNSPASDRAAKAIFNEWLGPR